MAADTSNNPYIIASADAGATDIPCPTAGARILIAKIRWVRGTGGVAGDNLSITNSAGKEIYAGFDTVTAATSSEEDTSDDFFPPLASLGLKVPTLTRGKVYIYLALNN